MLPFATEENQQSEANISVSSATTWMCLSWSMRDLIKAMMLPSASSCLYQLFPSHSICTVGDTFSLQMILISSSLLWVFFMIASLAGRAVSTVSFTLGHSAVPALLAHGFD